MGIDPTPNTINADGTAFDGGNRAILMAFAVFLLLAAVTGGFGLI